MSQRPKDRKIRGRYNGPVPTSNLIEADDFFDEPFPASDATPRSYGPGQGALAVVDGGVDMCFQTNKGNHMTSAYDTPNLVVRRGHEIRIRVTFNRAPTEQDDYQLEFMIGSDPAPNTGSRIVVTFGSRHGNDWTGSIVETQGSTVTLAVTPSPHAIVGKYRTYVAIDLGGSNMQRTPRDTNTDLYMLFNAWCPDDPVFYPEEGGRGEYVLADYGIIFQGAVGSVSSRGWMYGQFEKGVLDACIYVLDASAMPISDRGNPIKVVRKGSAMLNAQDDSGVLVGNWSDDYSLGTDPTMWTGSVKILLQYANTGVSVSFGQCWVFAGVFNTFLRCLGIPSRVITNFNSAHDNTGNLKTDLIFLPDGSPDEANTRDSILNYHCWNESYMQRTDLPPGLAGWQVVDGTPQETSDGQYRCGPASVAAIKDAQLSHQFDAAFVFAEVNSDVVFHERDKYGTLTTTRVDKTHIGQSICTKAIGSDARQDITHTYKYPEGSAEDEAVMSRAEGYGLQRDHSELPDSQLSVSIHCDQVSLGQDVNLLLDFENQGGVACTCSAHLARSVIFYTGVTANRLQDTDFTVTVPAHQTERVVLRTSAQEYMSQLSGQHALYFILTGKADDQSVSSMKVVELQSPSLTLTVSGIPQVQREMILNVSFTNTFNFPLLNVGVAMEGPGLVNYRTRYYSIIEPQAMISWNEAFYPRLAGIRRLSAVMACSNLPQVSGLHDIMITA